MSLYVRLFVDSLTNAKLMSVGPKGFAMWAKGLMYAKQHLTDGYVPRVALTLISIGDPCYMETVEELVSAGLWERDGDGYTIGAEKWAKHQTTKADVEKKREEWRKRKQRERTNHARATDDEREVHEDVTAMSRVTPMACHADVSPPEYREQSTENREHSPSSRERDPVENPSDPGRVNAYWEKFCSNYPSRSGPIGKHEALDKFRALSKTVDPAQILDGLLRYKRHCESVGHVDTPFVKQMSTWLNHSGWLEEYGGGEPKRSKALRLPGQAREQAN